MKVEKTCSKSLPYQLTLHQTSFTSQATQNTRIGCIKRLSSRLNDDLTIFWGQEIPVFKNLEGEPSKINFFSHYLFTQLFFIFNLMQISISCILHSGLNIILGMEDAKKLRTTIVNLAKQVGTYDDRIKVSAMIDLCTQIRSSTQGASMILL